MQFIYSENAGQKTIEFQNDEYNYLIKSRRSKLGDKISVRNLSDSFLYFYKIIEISKKSCMLEIYDSIEKLTKPQKKLEIVWCNIDQKIVEKQLPQLNQIGVSKISFVKCDFSQGNFEPNFTRLRKILINSCEQCGRTDLMKIDTITKDELQKLKLAYLDFDGETINNKIFDFNIFLIGPEGGFSQAEKTKLKANKCFKFDTDLILRSENAVTVLSSVYLLS